MLKVAYLANRIPSVTESYVRDEIEELRRRGVEVVIGSVEKPHKSARASVPPEQNPRIIVNSARLVLLVRALCLCIIRWHRIRDLIGRVILQGSEKTVTRAKALLHTWLGACYAVMLQDQDVDHIHVHHGYYGSWIAMVAARLLEIDFSLTLHGSDLLLHGIYLDQKLAVCSFCLTISEFNRKYIFSRYPQIERAKIVVARLGVAVENNLRFSTRKPAAERFTLLAVGRLHRVKNHEFLIRACAQLQQSGLDFECLIAGDGPERKSLERLIEKLHLRGNVLMLGQVAREQITSLCDRADLVVLTSRSEGIPLVLMEAMARAKLVLAPSITGIPELVIHGKTGFLYEPGALQDFVEQITFIRSQMKDSVHGSHALSAKPAKQLDWIRHAAYVHVRQNFNRKTALESFAKTFLSRVHPRKESVPHENFVLQQI